MIIRFDNLTNGEYLLKAEITAQRDGEFSLFGNHRHFLYHSQKISKGEKINGEFAVAIKNADFQKQDNYRDTAFELVCQGDVLLTAALEKKDFPTLYTLGDSTVCNQTHFGSGPLFRCGGWGQALSMFSATQYAVSNHAEQGTHTLDCLNCHVVPVLEQIKRGDLVLCQFGHNDQKNACLDPMGGYYRNLVRLGEAVKEKGADFIICTPINRLIYIDGKINNYLDPWCEGAKKAADALSVKCIDLHTFTTRMYISMGDEAEKLFYHSPVLDRTHPNDFGAIQIARFVSSNLQRR
ncbi:MAG: hypothetical protein IKU60_01490 [Clostridia bacterium]|nr:hypothetical protein [Clostridia bacterium]